MPNVNEAVVDKIRQLTQELEAPLDADVLGLFGPILGGLEHRVRAALQALPARRRKIGVVLQTVGGSIEVAERIVNVIRHHYSEVMFVVPDIALSAGTVLAMSGDSILMDYFSCLGPIDPQIERDGKLVPALSYLDQFERLVQKSAQGALTTAELALLNKLDLAELHTFEQARALTTDLLVAWLARYKFKNWNTTETRGTPVTGKMKEDRAREIATALSDHQRWRSHGRGISMGTLKSDLNLVIEDYAARPDVAAAVRNYYDIIVSCMAKENYSSFVTTRALI